MDFFAVCFVADIERHSNAQLLFTYLILTKLQLILNMHSSNDMNSLKSLFLKNITANCYKFNKQQKKVCIQSVKGCCWKIWQELSLTD